MSGLSEKEVRETLTRYGAILHGHFKLSSGLHSDTYVQCARVLEHPRAGHALGAALASKLTDRYGPIDVVAAPALGALLIGYAVADALDVRFVFAERTDGTMSFRRGQHVEAGERTVVIEDAVTTGGSANEVVGLLQSAGAEFLGGGSIIDRTTSEPPFALVSLLRVQAETFSPQSCPQCELGKPITAPGSRYVEPR